jgi:hypothetical protein
MLQINWPVIACFLIAFFAIAGFSRGWWKEAVTTISLAILVFFLANPELAGEFVNAINNVIATIWNFLPEGITSVMSEFLLVVFGIDTFGGAFQFDPSASATWMAMLALFVGGAVFIGHISFGNRPTLLGKILGTLVGAFNGFLILNISREYLDGRALPGQTTASSEAVLVGGSSFGAASESVTVQMTGLPDYTVMDSVIPWILMAVGLLFLFSVLKTRVGIASSQDGKKIQTKVPPFYKAPAKQKKKTLADLFNESV